MNINENEQTIIPTTVAEIPPESSPPPFPILWQRLGLGAVMLISIFFNFWQLGQNGFGNLYYAAAVRSMGDNWHAFFFNSFDSVGFVTLDKPPVGFWLQVISTKIFGFTPFAVLLPQALAGVASVYLLYILVKRHFGVPAGLLAALALAASPISVVTNRNNTIDSTLVAVILLATWCVFRATETGKLSWLLATGALIGLGFNIKMLEAYLVLPALALVYLLGTNKRLTTKIAHLLIAGVLMATISFAWIAVVDLTPASQRPYIGSSQNNSALSLAIGYNGLQRLLGNSRGGGTAPGVAGGNGGTRPTFPTGGNFNGPPPNFGGSGHTPPTGTTPNAGGPNGGNAGGPGGGGQGMFNTGNPGIFRLFSNPLGGQIAWFLPLAIAGFIALAWQRRFRPIGDKQQQSLLLWGTWLLTMGIFFSVASFFHQYYLSQFTPAISALFGIGLVTMWKDYRGSSWKGWLLPASIAVTALVQIGIIAGDSSWGSWLIPVIAVPALGAVAVLVWFRLNAHPVMTSIRMLTIAGIAVAALTLTPFIWSAYPAINNTSSDLPIAGSSSSFGAAGGNNNQTGTTGLITYLEAHQGSATYLVATSSSMSADSIIIASNKPVMSLGGFSGSDPILTTSELTALVKNGTVRYFLLNGAGGGGNNMNATATGTTAAAGPGGQSTATSWVQQTCTVVASSAYQSTTANMQSSGQLYDCGSIAG